MSAKVIVSQPVEESEGPHEDAVDWGGIPVIIEYRKGESRPIGDGEGTMYMQCPYGYVEGTVSMEEGDALDVFMCNEPEADKIFIISMLKDGVLEEEKVFLGFGSQEDAEEMFRNHYGDEKLGPVYVMTKGDFEKLVKMRSLEAGLKNKLPTTDVVADSTPFLYVDLEEPAVVLQKNLSKVPLHSVASLLTGPQLGDLLELRKSTVVGRVEGSSKFARLNSETGLFDPKDLVEVALSKGVSGSGHKPGDLFSARKLSYEEYGILVLKSGGVAPETIAKALGVSFDEVLGKLRGWMVVPRG